MEENKKSKNKKKFLLLFLFLLLIFYLLFRFIISKPAKTNINSTNNTPSNNQISIEEPSKPENIIKCQSVVVAPTVTTELFTFKSGKNMLADYRINAKKEADSFKIQILYDGERVYFWKPPIYFGQEPKPINPPGLKMKINDFNYALNLSPNGSIERFGKSPFSGDHMCSQWDGATSIFDLPEDFIFNESDDTLNSIKADLEKICSTCDSAGTDDFMAACRKNLICE